MNKDNNFLIAYQICLVSERVSDKVIDRVNPIVENVVYMNKFLSIIF